MEKKMNIYQRMHAVMGDIEGVVKRKKSAGMFYDFVSHDDIAALVRQPHIEHGILAVPSVITYTVDHSNAAIPIDSKGSPRICHSLHLKITFHNIDDPSDCIVVDGFGYAVDRDDKGYGKAFSYAVKYALLKTYTIPSGNQDEIDAYQGENQEAAAAQPAAPVTASKPLVLNPKQIDMIKQKLQGFPELRNDVLLFTGKKSVSDIEYERFQSVINLIDMKIAKIAGVA